MKLLPSAPLTQEDWSAWLHARHGFLGIPWAHLVGAYEAADRRDAELMLKAQYKRIYAGGAVFRNTAVRVGDIDCGWRLS